MKFIIFLVLFGCIQSFSDAANECIAGTNEKCVPFTWEGATYDECEGYWSKWCVGKDQSGSEYSPCGECVEPQPTPGNEFDVPANHKTTISEDKFSTVSTNEDKVTKETSIESSGDSIDDTEPSIETTNSVINENKLDEQLDPKSAKKQKCVLGTKKICTPFTYRGDNYDECYAGLYSYQCRVDGEWSYCGDCIEDTLVTDATAVSTTKASKETSVESSGDSNDDTESSLETTEGNLHNTETSVENSGDNTDDTEPSIGTTEDSIHNTEPSIGATGKTTESTELDEQLDAPKSVRKQKCVQGTNIVCTPFVHNGEIYDDCATSYWNGDWCLVKSPVKSFYPSCGECVEQL